MKTTQIAHKAEGAMADGARTARSRLEGRLDQQSGPSAEQARKMAEDVNAVSDELARRGRERPARMAGAAAQGAERIGDYLERADGRQMIDDFSRYGREHPGVVGIAGFTAGFLAARFLKAGSGGLTGGSGSGGGPDVEGASAPSTLGAPDASGVRPAGVPPAGAHPSGAAAGGASGTTGARPAGAPAAGGHGASGSPSGGR
ncbi:MAG TPA: hypothetical protein VNT51_11010 [Miltoncostaeaceae bacterium]|nr:hypothetical protein [Miltoncostaeaceae bacterium]